MRIDKDVLLAISNSTTDGNNLTLLGQLDRNMYVKVNKVLEACGGKWNKKLKCHVFDNIASERIDQILLTGEVEVPKDEFNYFPTPKPIVEMLLSEAKLSANMNVLEPSAGRGAIAFECSKLGSIVDCYELNDDNYNFLKDNTSLKSVTKCDFISVVPEEKYDRVVMNPPFKNQQDIKHVLHALKFLKADGILVSVMSNSVTFRTNSLTNEFKDILNKHNGKIIELPEKAFKESGTMVNTVMVVMYK